MVLLEQGPGQEDIQRSPQFQPFCGALQNSEATSLSMNPPATLGKRPTESLSDTCHIDIEKGIGSGTTTKKDTLNE